MREDQWRGREEMRWTRLRCMSHPPDFEALLWLMLGHHPLALLLLLSACCNSRARCIPSKGFKRKSHASQAGS